MSTQSSLMDPSESSSEAIFDEDGFLIHEQEPWFSGQEARDLATPMQPEPNPLEGRSL